MYINRQLEKTIHEATKHFKIILITGARQTGKSTLLKYCAKSRNYVTLDDYNARQLAIKEPKLFLEKYAPPIIIDEIQYAPNLLPYIKMEVDKSDKCGQYWLTGSQQFRMMKNVTESLAGRVAILELSGFSLKEIERVEQKPFIPAKDYIKQAQKNSKYYGLNIYENIWRGFYPQINADKEADWTIFYNSYLNTYIERDIKDLNMVKNELEFLQFLKVIAARTGQMLNYNEISNEVGVSLSTIKHWVSVLVSSNIIFLLQPYFKNINKRLIKTPKIYFSDTGLCSHLLGWNNPKVLESGAMAGAMFETFVVGEIIKSYKNNAKVANIYYYRDKEKREIDVLIEENGKIYPIEIKKTANPDKSMVKNFSVIPEDIRAEGALLCLCDDYIPLDSKTNAISIGYI